MAGGQPPRSGSATWTPHCSSRRVGTSEFFVGAAEMLRLGFAALGAAPTEPPQSTLLSRTPMIMAHDAGSGYLPGDGLIGRWTRTQSGGLDAQLECGARAFDARPLYRRGRLMWHHGAVAVEVPFAQAVEQAVEWLGVRAQTDAPARASHMRELCALQAHTRASWRC